jgi:hypothetical protein
VLERLEVEPAVLVSARDAVLGTADGLFAQAYDGPSRACSTAGAALAGSATAAALAGLARGSDDALDAAACASRTVADLLLAAAQSYRRVEQAVAETVRPA